MFLKKLSALTFYVAAPTAIPAVAQDFKGVTVDILTRPGYVIAGLWLNAEKTLKQ